MKILTVSVIALASLLTATSAFAAEISSDISGKQKFGVVSAEGAYSLDGLTDMLSDKAQAKGATAMKVISAGGVNKLYGVAEIYK
ncbi:MAG: DUF1471 domain-containing protein [Pantoea sp.]|uniref:YdgH/BhsA/McbA-like domain containing protein n=1 Tax=Pantoea sp. TaxID=69393 RepID=UPI00239EA384|nr:YdgH/BhsA/McbA-like domain containing protein [Pantoea sp.]MDE1189050.1 DUF1471 domain-containing protein [Pantoea sp.]